MVRANGEQKNMEVKRLGKNFTMDAESGKLMLAEITDEYVHDTTFLEDVLKRANGRKGKILIDGIADSRRCYEMAKRYNKKLLTPPSSRAIIRKEKGYEDKNEAIRIIKGLGGDRIAKSIWSKLVGYNRRVAVEGKMSMWKRVLGPSLKSRYEQRKKIEVQIKAMMINQMMDAAA
jgi:Transposase DDE domain